MKVQFDLRFPKNLPRKCRFSIKKAAEKTLKALPQKATRPLRSPSRYTLTVSVVNDSQMKKLNRFYRKKNKTTDVLSFSQLEGEQLLSASPQIGDVILSLPTAKRQAKEYGFSLERELARLTIHGVLHLFGYDHERSKKEERRMFRLQDKIFARF